MRKPKHEIWVHYQQIAGEWGWRISDGNTTIWSGSLQKMRTDYEAIRNARDSFISTWPDADVPREQIFRTGREYALATLEKR